MSRSKRGFTLVELLVVIGIIALLISILLPALTRAKDQARTVACASNMRQCAMAMNMYMGDNKGLFPLAYDNGYGQSITWFSVLVGQNYLSAPQQDAANDDPSLVTSGSSVLICPSTGTGVSHDPDWGSGTTDYYDTNFNRIVWRFSDPTGYSGKPDPLIVDCSYAINTMQNDWTNASSCAVFVTRQTGGTSSSLLTPRKINMVGKTTMLAMFWDGTGFKTMYQTIGLSARHNGNKVTNFAFFDGHVESFDPRPFIPGALNNKLNKTVRYEAPIFRLNDSRL